VIFFLAGGGIAYFAVYLPFLTGRPHMNASFAAPLMIGYGLALLLFGQGLGPTMYRRKDASTSRRSSVAHSLDSYMV
jgi:hypothetical protein